MPCFRILGIGASLFKPFWWGERARRRADRTSSRTPNHWQSLQPVFAIIIGDDCALTAFSSPQPTFFDLRISRSAPDPVTLAKLVNAHRPLQRAALSLDF
jgi:hypothetical protein